MSCCNNQHDLCVKLGATFNTTFYWTTTPYISKPITGITNAAPAVVTAVAHGILSGFRAAVVSAQGMLPINSQHYPPETQDWHVATYLTADTIQFNEVNSADWPAWTSGGFLIYETPQSLLGASAVMTIRDDPLIGNILLQSPAGITLTLNDTTKTINATFPTAGLTWTAGFYDLEVTDSNGITWQIASGEIDIE